MHEQITLLMQLRMSLPGDILPVRVHMLHEPACSFQALEHRLISVAYFQQILRLDAVHFTTMASYY